MRDGKHLILYVDDDQDVLDGIRLVLENNGYGMIEAHSGEQGLRTYKQNADDVDLLVVDLMMEEVDAGTNLVKELKAVGCDKPMFIVSSVGDGLNLNASAEQLGVDGVLQKPVDHKILLGLLERKLGG